MKRIAKTIDDYLAGLSNDQRVTLTVRFDRPLPDALVRRLVKTRMAEHVRPRESARRSTRTPIG